MKVDVAITRYRSYPADARDMIDVAIGNLGRSGADLRVMRYGGSLIHHQRNHVVSARRPDADFLVMIDDDMMPEPNALVRLLAHQVPAASALCTTREIPSKLCLSAWDESRGFFTPVDWIRPGQVYQGHFAVGGAFLALSRTAIESLEEQYISAEDWMHMNAAMFDRMEVSITRRRAEQRRVSEARAELAKREPQSVRIFDFDVLESQTQTGEDVALGYRLKWLGYTVVVDSSIRVDHMGAYGYGLKDVPVPADIKAVA